VVDDGTLLRVARFALGGDGPGNLALLPGIVSDAARGKLSADLMRLVAADPLLCAGYRPLCDRQKGFAWGVYLTVFCRDQLPFLDRSELRELAAGEPAYEKVFVNSPYLEACAAWDVQSATRPPRTHVDAGVPLLLLSGQFDSFSPPEWSRAAARRHRSVWALEVPGQTHNTLGFSDCAISIRNSWVRAPSLPPRGTGCLAASARRS
jgi:pimeloyl-ACP methyl ester carboxylesterase